MGAASGGMAATKRAHSVAIGAEELDLIDPEVRGPQAPRSARPFT